MVEMVAITEGESLEDPCVVEDLETQVRKVLDLGEYRSVVVGIVRDFDGRVLFTMSPKAVTDLGMNWNLPQGGVRDGEGIIAALKRELNEEVGLREEDIIIDKSFGYSDYLLPPGREHRKGYKGKRYFWISLRCKPDARIMPDLNEVQFCVWANKEMQERCIDSIRAEKREDVRRVLELSKL